LTGYVLVFQVTDSPTGYDRCCGVYCAFCITWGMADRSPKHGLTRGTRGWYKRINGKPSYIVSDKLCPTGEAADAFYQENFKHLWAVKAAPKPVYGSVTVADLFDAHLVVLRGKLAAGELEPMTLAVVCGTYQAFLNAVGDRPVNSMGPEDFAKANAAWAELAPKSRRRKMIVIRGAFKWGCKPPLRLPVPDYGDSFTPPGERVIRRHRAKQRAAVGLAIFSPEEIRVQLDGVTMTRSNGRRFPIRPNKAMRAMILLGINAGMGNTDCAALPKAAVNLDTGWIEYPRQKTGAERKAKLWPETVAAIRDYLAVRPKPRDKADAGRLFLTRAGQPYLQMVAHREDYVERRDEIAELYRRMLKRMDQHRAGRSFYSLRRTFRTLGAETGEEMALNLAMGHAGSADDMSRIYTHVILDAKLEAIANHVRARIFTAG
jgi:hypothetical protein